VSEERHCGHCGRPGATAWAADVPLCHPDDPSLPDCYRRVSVYAEPVGALLFVDPGPAGTEGIMRLEGGRLVVSAEIAAARELTALTEELGLYDYDAGPDCG
jgi:hypothetical protein